jgi:hypothetical protein
LSLLTILSHTWSIYVICTDIVCLHFAKKGIMWFSTHECTNSLETHYDSNLCLSYTKVSTW